MANLHFENVVATGDLDTRIKFSEILDLLDLPYLRYDPDIHQGLELRFVEGGPLITMYATGKYIIRAPSLDELYQTREDLLELLSDKGIIDEPTDDVFNINNIVASGDIGREVNLQALEADLDVGNVNYDPIRHSALQCKLQNHKATILLYRSGKVIVTGEDSVEGTESSYDEFRNALEALFCLHG